MALPAALLIGGAVAAAAGAGAKAGGRAKAAKNMGLNYEEEQELEELQRRRAAGELGLTDAQEQRIDQQLLTQRGGLMRQQQATALQQAAQQGPNVSGRDIFLREQLAQGEQKKMIREENVQRARAQASAEQQQMARQAFLRQQQITAAAARAQAIGDMIGDPLQIGGQAAMSYGTLSAQGKISPYAGKTDTDILDVAVVEEDEIFIEDF